MMMKSKPFLLLLLTGLAHPAAAADNKPNHRNEQRQAFEATQLGAARSLRSIENDIVPRMRGQGADYIGQEFNGDQNRYRLKFMKGKSLIWVDVDGRTGAIIGQAGG